MNGNVWTPEILEATRDDPPYGFLVLWLVGERLCFWLVELGVAAAVFGTIRLFDWLAIVPTWWLSAGLLTRFAMPLFFWWEVRFILLIATWGLVCLLLSCLSQFGLDPTWTTGIVQSIYLVRLKWRFIRIVGVIRVTQWSRGRVAIQAALDLERGVQLQLARTTAELAARSYLNDGFVTPAAQSHVYAGQLASYCGDLSLARDHFRRALELLEGDTATCQGLELPTRAIAELNYQRAMEVLGESDPEGPTDAARPTASALGEPLYLATQWVFPFQPDLLHGVYDLEYRLLAIATRVGVSGSTPHAWPLIRWLTGTDHRASSFTREAINSPKSGIKGWEPWHRRETHELWREWCNDTVHLQPNGSDYWQSLQPLTLGMAISGGSRS